ncbi:hypothetical protein P3X46_014450 [Hevea brasiliensis]|uniref:Cation/H+ exchanger transmembrane domain-containing protein n=1 Tax=Hevea brasiliensis TaxID=3981 RepID=A0ABQ9M6Q1_HEVBR|nr:hypothetical protein P3X46_014450 [Hevea brasiliensis]
MNVSQYKFIVNLSAGCFDYISASSDGTWNVKHGGTILEHPFFRFQLQLISMVIIAHFFLIGYVIMFTFLAAVRMDISLVKRSGARIILLGFLVFALPYTSRTLRVKFDRSVINAQKSARLNNANLYFYAFTTSEFIDISALLVQHKITNSRLGHLALATTLVSDLTRPNTYIHLQ